MSWRRILVQQAEHIEKLDEQDSFATDRNDALGKLVATIQDEVTVDGMLHPALDVIAHYDAENQTDLLHTLKVYLENDCNAQKCGRLLFLHRNSLVYRIHRIQEISGCNLSDPRERSYLRISFLLRR